jgi:antitoxin component of MazEF toxin-antitoxin module
MRKAFVTIERVGGLTIPRRLLNRAKLQDDVEIVVDGDTIVIRPKGWNPRAGWEEAIEKAVAEHGNEYTEVDIEWMNAPMGPIPDEKPT